MKKLTVSFPWINKKYYKKHFFVKDYNQATVDNIITEINSMTNVFGTPLPLTVCSDIKLVDDINKRIKSSPFVSRDLSCPLNHLVFNRTDMLDKTLQKILSDYKPDIYKDKNRIYIGFDIGGTYIKSIAIKNRKLLSQTFSKLPTPTKRNKITPTLTKLFTITTKQLNPTDIGAIGIGIPGFAYNGVIVKLSNLTQWNNFPITKDLGLALVKYTGFKTPIRIDNDANLAVLRNSLNTAKPNSITLAVGTGIGGGIVYNYNIFRGISGTAGELHFNNLNFRGPGLYCTCGIKSGCFESICSSRGIVNRRMIECNRSVRYKLQNKQLLNLVARVSATGVIKDDDCKKISIAAENGDSLALKVIRETAFDFVEGMNYLYKLTNIKNFILSGGVMQGIIKTVIINIVNKPTNNYPFNITIVKDVDTAGAEGAALFAQQEMLK